MADVYHHALSSTKKWGGEIEDYLPIHQWFDETKKHFADPRHRALRHHSEGIGLMISIFGPTVSVTIGYQVGDETFLIKDWPGAGGNQAKARAAFRARDLYDLPPTKAFELHVTTLYKEVPTRWVGEQHVLEDFGHIPTAADFLRHMTTEAWMVKGARKLSRELEAPAREERHALRATQIETSELPPEVIERLHDYNDAINGRTNDAFDESGAIKDPELHDAQQSQ